MRSENMYLNNEIIETKTNKKFHFYNEEAKQKEKEKYNKILALSKFPFLF
jgi:hypothetical protein